MQKERAPARDALLFANTLKNERLEVELAGQLNRAGWRWIAIPFGALDHARNLSECGVGQLPARRRKVGVVEDVEALQPQLHIPCSVRREREALRHAQVRVVESGPAEEVSRRIAKRSHGFLAERRGVEVIVARDAGLFAAGRSPDRTSVIPGDLEARRVGIVEAIELAGSVAPE